MRTAGQVVKLDRGYPLVRLADGSLVRCEHAKVLIKGADQSRARAVIGDEVELEITGSHEKAVLCAIAPRRCELVRKDPTERALPQVLAANFDIVMIVQPLGEVNLRRLERELVLAHETHARVMVLLTKADLADDESSKRTCDDVRALVSDDVRVVVLERYCPEAIDAVRAAIGPGELAVLLGRSGVGKSTLVNALVGADVLKTGAVRESDGKGRHTTVSRQIIDLPDGGRIVDMPGVRGVGLWDADDGLETAFADIEELGASCRFRDCTHSDEPGCAVRAAVEAGELASERWRSYLELRKEMEKVADRREQARWLSGEKQHKKQRKPRGKGKRLQ